ncbi:hypothetical protein EYZ11_003345 [Aspergillus tanneri]|uniref:Nephrocystin 3-like N-terminal domain-containing protein n=1 Tax=Aspergillus tanneri TaxID=1220188 RepID=A0A4S3JP15_9EURO|nr:hypothetical protein EYZ11_003345 [Aspergillus tanneri]
MSLAQGSGLSRPINFSSGMIHPPMVLCGGRSSEKCIDRASDIAVTRNGEPVAILFFFFHQFITANHDPHVLARLEGLRKGNRQAKDIGFKELWQSILHAIPLLEKVYCFVAALDELDRDHTHGFLQHLVALGRKYADRIKLVMTSRPFPQI